MSARRPLRFWLAAMLVGALATLGAAALVATLIGLSVGAEQIWQRGLAAFTLWNMAKGLALVGLYLGFFALFVLPFALIATPVSYAAAFRVSRRAEPQHVFVALSLVFGVAGPVAVEIALNLAHYLAGASPRLHALTLSPVFAGFGLFAAPVTALAIWPILRRLEARLGRAPSPSLQEVKA